MGDVFDPRSCGFSPGKRVREIPERSRIAGSTRRFGAHHKLLYEVLLAFACKGTADVAVVSAKVASIQRDLGLADPTKPSRAVMMRLADLEAMGLIRRERHGRSAPYSRPQDVSRGGRAFYCFLLWHACFDARPVSERERSKCKVVPIQVQTAACVYKENKFSQVQVPAASSSATQGKSRANESSSSPSQAADVTTNRARSSSEPRKTPNVPEVWTGALRERAREYLTPLLDHPEVSFIDNRLLDRILACFPSIVEFQAYCWLISSRRQFVGKSMSIRSGSWFVADLESWADRRDQAVRQFTKFLEEYPVEAERFTVEGPAILTDADHRLIEVFRRTSLATAPLSRMRAEWKRVMGTSGPSSVLSKVAGSRN